MAALKSSEFSLSSRITRTIDALWRFENFFGYIAIYLLDASGMIALPLAVHAQVGFNFRG